jgi:peptide deformylase
MILPIIAFGNPVLKRIADDIPENFEGLSALLTDMFETMYAAKGVGLAAPQIGESIRLFIVDGSPFANEEGEEIDPKAIGIEGFKKVFINPIIEEESGDLWPFQEGCLSIPKIRENVNRRERICVSYYDENWSFHREEFDGYKARIIQHEYDHLEGILFTDKLSPLKKKLLSKRLGNVSIGIVEVDYKMMFNKKK